jgi:hypothetical protein
MIGVTNALAESQNNVHLLVTLPTRLARCEGRSIVETVPYIEQQLEHRTSSRTNLSSDYLIFLKIHGAHFDEKYLWD